MNSRERFAKVMRYEPVDRVPYFEEGIRDEVIAAWKKQGMSENSDISTLFETDRREEIFPDLEPIPELKKWPVTRQDLKDFKNYLNPSDPARLPEKWDNRVGEYKDRDHVVMLRVHRGFFLSMGVHDWSRFMEVVFKLKKDPEFVHEALAIYAQFCASIADKILNDIDVDAAIFSEPIGGNDHPLMSPAMYEEFVLKSYVPIMNVLKKHDVGVVIFRTFGNSRILIPKILKYGFNCLWACEVNISAMDYRNLRKEFGKDLRLIGGIDLDALRKDKESIRDEVETKVPELLGQGGYIPLADGRVREDVPFENYVYYRQLLKKVTTSFYK
jgi:uroporphyrinogen decarboxylase